MALTPPMSLPDGPLQEMALSVLALSVELPGAIHEDVVARWEAVLALIDEHACQHGTTCAGLG